MELFITGSNGLIGPEYVRRFGSQGATVTGLDNNLRRAKATEKA